MARYNVEIGPPKVKILSWITCGELLRNHNRDLRRFQEFEKSAPQPKPSGDSKTAESKKMEDRNPGAVTCKKCEELAPKKPEEVLAKNTEEVTCKNCGITAKNPEGVACKKHEAQSFKKIEETKATEAPKAEESKNSGSDSNLTPEQDATLLRLKTENKSWKQIAVEMGLAKSEAQQRYKELQKVIHQQAAALAGHDIKGSNTKSTKDATANSETPKTSEQCKDTHAEALTTHTRNRWDGVGGVRIQDDRRLNPDEFWNVEDCELLEFLEARYINEKWLQMQSKFYNWTGRMIRSEIIERKMKERGPNIGMNGEGV